jgi:hypothetical protein
VLVQVQTSTGSHETYAKIVALVSSHPLCGQSMALWGGCQDVIETAHNMLQAADPEARAAAVDSGDISVGNAFAFIADDQGQFTQAHPALKSLIGQASSLSSLADPSKCTRISDDSVCIRVYTSPETQETCLSILVGNFTDMQLRRRRLHQEIASEMIHGCVWGAAFGIPAGAVRPFSGAFAEGLPEGVRPAIATGVDEGIMAMPGDGGDD